MKDKVTNCRFTEKISALIDDELSEAESSEIRKHINICTDCQSIEKDFLFFREQIKQSVAEEFGQEGFTRKKKQKSFFNKKISLPIPAFAVLILLFLSVSVWFLASSTNKNAQDLTEKVKQKKKIRENADTQSENSLARFDGGGKAEIYVVPR